MVLRRLQHAEREAVCCRGRVHSTSLGRATYGAGRHACVVCTLSAQLHFGDAKQGDRPAIIDSFLNRRSQVRILPGVLDLGPRRRPFPRVRKRTQCSAATGQPPRVAKAPRTSRRSQLFPCPTLAVRGRRWLPAKRWCRNRQRRDCRTRNASTGSCTSALQGTSNVRTCAEKPARRKGPA